MRGNQHLVARPDAQPHQPGRQPIGAAGAERELADAEMLGVALLEALAFAVVAIAEQFARADDLRDGLDLFFARQIHRRLRSSVQWNWYRLMHPVTTA